MLPAGCCQHNSRPLGIRLPFLVLASPDIVVVNAVLCKLQTLRAQLLQHPGKCVAYPARRRVGTLAKLSPGREAQDKPGGWYGQRQGR